MKPRPFDYAQPDTAEEAIALLAEYGDEARVLAGGQSLLPMLNLRLIDPQLLIDISRIKELDVIRDLGDKIEIGAAVTQNKLMAWPQLRQKLPLVAAALPYVGHFQTRNRGTVCGSIAHADPSAELPLVFSVLGGDVMLRSKKRKRVLKAEDFFQGMLMTAREPDELVEGVRFPLKRAGERYGFTEFSARHGDFAMVACATVVTDTSIRIAVGGVADRPVVEQWPRLHGEDLRGALNDLSWKLNAQDDSHVSATYRRHLVRQLGWRVIEEAK
jgi:2-furoyl-CoA dehydrogenase FAD binding subunit